MPTNLKEQSKSICFEVSQDNIRFEVRDQTSTKYPSVYLTYKCTSANSIDRLKTVINSAGCTNLYTGVTGVYNDVEHNDYFSKRQDTQVFKNAGQLVSLELIGTDLYATSRIGKEHNIIDINQKIVSSSYASAWLTYAQHKIAETGGDIRSVIPDNIYLEFFEGQTIEPYKNVSVEISFEHYLEDNTTRFDGIVMINKFDLVRVSFLTQSAPGQQDSGFTEYEIRKLKNNIMPNENKITIRCLSDAKVNDLVVDNNTGLVYELTSITDTDYNLLGVEDQTEYAVAKADGCNFDMVDDTMIKKDISRETRSYIRMCMQCQKAKNAKRDDTTVEPGGDLAETTIIKADVVLPNAEIEALRAEITTLKDLVQSLIPKEVVRTDTIVDDTIPTEPGAEPTLGDEPTEGPDNVTTDEVKDIVKELDDSIRSFKPFTFTPKSISQEAKKFQVFGK
jgi:hypothetical protein